MRMKYWEGDTANGEREHCENEDDNIDLVRPQMRMKYWVGEAANGERDYCENEDGNIDRVKPEMRMQYWEGETADGEGELYPQCDQLSGDPRGQVINHIELREDIR